MIECECMYVSIALIKREYKYNNTTRYFEGDFYPAKARSRSRNSNTTRHEGHQRRCHRHRPLVCCCPRLAHTSHRPHLSLAITASPSQHLVVLSPIAPHPMDEELQSTVFDAIVLGTGIAESFVAAYVGRSCLARVARWETSAAHASRRIHP